MHLLILGLARQGKALAQFAVGERWRVTISDQRTTAQLTTDLAELADLPITYVLGGHPESMLDGVDVLALSGGVPADGPLAQAAVARGIRLTNDSLEFTRRCPAPTIGITGSAGKTTTTTLVGLMGQTAARRTWVGGNIGRPLISDLAEMTPSDVVVQELSSFQLELWDRSPEVAAVLNITPNHLDRHKTMATYSAAKANIVRHQTGAETAVLCADDTGAMALQGLVRGRLRLFSQHQPVADGAFIRDGQIWLADGRGSETAVCSTAEVRLRGAHNLLNILAACTLADSVGLPTAAMREVIRTFGGVEHRLELVATKNGVQYINDSIATAPERALAGIAAVHEPIILLAGGKDKDMVWEEWAQVVRQRVKYVVLFGALADLLAEKLGDDFTAVGRAANLAEAVQIATAHATPGDVVLLSPGGTSYDAFRDFAERGELFRQLVASG